MPHRLTGGGKGGLAPAIAIAIALLATGCGGEGESATVKVPETALAHALETVGSATNPVGEGYGFVDLAALRRSGERAGWAAGALGPGGSELISDRGAIERELGLDPVAAARLVSVATSYTLGVRADEAEARPLANALADTPARRSRSGEWRFLDLGDSWSIPLDTPAEVLGGLGARIGLGPGAVVVARTDRARTELTAESLEVFDDPGARLATACLGNVVAARLVPNNFTHAFNTGPQLLAFGVRLADPEPTEVLCAVDPSEDVAAGAADAMRRRLVPDAVDAVSGERIGDEVASRAVDELAAYGAYAARAELTLAPGAKPGFLFGAFDTGSLVTYLGLPPPPELPD